MPMLAKLINDFLMRRHRTLVVEHEEITSFEASLKRELWKIRGIELLLGKIELSLSVCG